MQAKTGTEKPENGSPQTPTKLTNGSSLPPENPSLPREVITKIALVLNKMRVNSLFNIYSPKESLPAVYTAVELMERHRVPLEDLNDCLLAAFDHRIAAMRENAIPPDLTIEFVISKHSQIVAERREKAVKAGQTLTAEAMSQCEKCNGTCSEIVPGKGARPCTNGCRKI